MALDAISGAIYNNANNITQRTNSHDAGVVNLSISETPVPIKTTASGQTGNEQETGQKDKSPSEKQIRDAISKVNSKIREGRTRCEFSYIEETNRISIKMIDENTNEVIKEIPPEDSIKMVEKMYELAGILIDERR